MSDIAIRVENLTKKFFLGERVGIKTFREALQDLVTAPFRVWKKNGQGDGQEKIDTEREIWALKGVSFEVKHGEVLGIIGPNGAGKSTLLKILSRITEPTGGYAEIRGRVGSLLEVGTGFHPELTGRENVYLNGAILGMSKAEIRRKFDDIVSFAGVEKFIDTPVKRYSSGMQVRLAFAVAAHLDPEILIIDEVLAVGDAEFQKRCLGKMNEVSRSGRTVLFVSHNMAAVQSLCGRVVVLENGRPIIEDTPEVAISEYLSRRSQGVYLDLGQRTDREGTGDLRFTRISIATGKVEDTECIQSGNDVSIILSYTVRRPIHHPTFYLGFYDVHGTKLFHCTTALVAFRTGIIDAPGKISCRIPRIPLSPGQYYINVAAQEANRQLDRVERAKNIVVEPGDFFGTGKVPSHAFGKVLVVHSWLDEP